MHICLHFHVIWSLSLLICLSFLLCYSTFAKSYHAFIVTLDSSCVSEFYISLYFLVLTINIFFPFSDYGLSSLNVAYLPTQWWIVQNKTQVQFALLHPVYTH